MEPSKRIYNLYHINTRSDGIIKYKPRLYQAAALSSWYEALYSGKGGRFLYLKGRQAGGTATSMNFCLDNVCYRPYTNAMTIAHTEKAARGYFNNIARFSWERIPEQVRPPHRFDNKGAIDLTLKGSTGGAYHVSKDIKGTTQQILHAAELAYFTDDEVIKEGLNVVPTNGVFIGESTANGVGNFFEQKFTDAMTAQEEGKHHYWNAVFWPWYENPTNVIHVEEYMELMFPNEVLPMQEKYGLTDEQAFFYDAMIDMHGPLCPQYFPSDWRQAFISSGECVFNLAQLDALETDHATDPQSSFEGIKVWETNRQSQRYSIGVDEAEGKENSDNSAIVVIDSMGKQVCEVAGKIDPPRLVQLLAKICGYYKNHTCVIESNRTAVLHMAKEYNHIKLYRAKGSEKVKSRKVMNYGWFTGKKSKHLMIQRLNRAIKEGSCIPRSKELYNELKSFTYKESGTIEASGSNKDDRVIALALANIGAEDFSPQHSRKLSDYGII